MESYIPAIGATCLGAVIGWLVRYFIRRFERFGPAALASIVSLILGGAVVKFLEADRSVWWFYPIGLFVGMAIYQVIAIRYGRSPNTDPSSPGNDDGSAKGGGGGGVGGWGKNNPVFDRIRHD
jgi:O-antigen/teichoic acid export membrane protein